MVHHLVLLLFYIDSLNFKRTVLQRAKIKDMIRYVM